jgi:hypothetical protein
MSKKSIKDKMLNYVFSVSKQPVRYKDLLAANALYNEGMYVDSAKLNFRMNLSRVYLIYTALCVVILFPLIFVIHFMPELNIHIPIIVVVVITSAVFACFHYFVSWLRDGITLKLIKGAWTLHFPYFSYEKYSKRVEELYIEIRKKDLPRKDWEQYVLDGILK